MRSFAITRALALLPLVTLLACANRLPSPGPARDVAIGDITHSMPLFTPLNGYDASRSLDFSATRSEAALAERISQANLGIDEIAVTYTEIAAALSVAGKQVTSSTSQSSKSGTGNTANNASNSTANNASSATSSSSSGSSTAPTTSSNSSNTSSTSSTDTAGNTGSSSSSRDQTSSQTTSQQTPGIPALPDNLTPDAAVQSKLIDLLARADKKHVLPPDDVATIVASLKMYQNALEEYYNATTLYEATVAGDSEWIPYRVHFTVTAEPGWYTQAHDHDAVVEIDLGDDTQIRIINVIPAQSLQTIEQFNAAYRSLKAALSASGSYSKVAAST